MEAGGLNLDAELIVSAESVSHAAGLGCSRELLSRRNRCTAIVAGNDVLAIGSSRAMQEAGLPCPLEISVVGPNDVPFLSRL